MSTIIKRTFAIEPGQLLPPVTPDNEPFWNGLAQGRLQLQACGACARVRNPIAPACPYCGSNAWEWREMSGEGTVFSFARFHRSYLPEFEDLMPYVVLTVELAEGARMFGRLIEHGLSPRAMELGASPLGMEHGVAPRAMELGVSPRAMELGVSPRIGQPVRLVIEEWPGGRCVAAFEMA